MENASKALIIIGAILIALLLVSGGVYVLGLMNDPQDQAADSAKSQSIEMFNSKFTPYAGTQRGSSVKQLVSATQAVMGTNTQHTIATVNVEGTNAVNTGDVTEKLTWIQAHTNSQQIYTVSFGYASGYINSITINGTWNT